MNRHTKIARALQLAHFPEYLLVVNLHSGIKQWQIALPAQHHLEMIKNKLTKANRRGFISLAHPGQSNNMYLTIVCTQFLVFLIISANYSL